MKSTNYGVHRLFLCNFRSLVKNILIRMLSNLSSEEKFQCLKVAAVWTACLASLRVLQARYYPAGILRLETDEDQGPPGLTILGREQCAMLFLCRITQCCCVGTFHVTGFRRTNNCKPSTIVALSFSVWNSNYRFNI